MSYVPTVAGKLSISFASFLPVFIVDRVDLRRTDWETFVQALCFNPNVRFRFSWRNPPWFRKSSRFSWWETPDFWWFLLQPCQWAPVALRIDPDHIWRPENCFPWSSFRGTFTGRDSPVNAAWPTGQHGDLFWGSFLGIYRGDWWEYWFDKPNVSVVKFGENRLTWLTWLAQKCINWPTNCRHLSSKKQGDSQQDIRNQ